MTLPMSLQNLHLENSMLLMTNIMENMVKEIKMIQVLNLKQKLLMSLCDYSDAYVLVTGNITASGGHENTIASFKFCALFRRCVTHIND